MQVASTIDGCSTAVEQHRLRRTWWSSEWLAFVWSSVPGLLLAVAAAANIVSEQLALGLFAISFVGLNLMHMGATWARVYVRPSWREAPLERLAVPIGLVTLALAYEALGGGAILLAIQYFLSFHHALMQNYGLMRASQRRTGRRVDIRLDLAACLLLPGAALLYRAQSVCREYAGAALPAVSTSLVQVMAGAGVVALLAFAAREWNARQQGGAVDPIAAGIVFGTNLMWSALLIADPHPAIPLYALASGHYVQYLYFVRQVETRDVATTAAPFTAGLQAGLRASPLHYLVVLLAISAAVVIVLTGVSIGMRAAAVAMQWRPAGALDLAPWAAAMLGVNLEHYWLDHRIWRTPKAPRLRLA